MMSILSKESAIALLESKLADLKEQIKTVKATATIDNAEGVLDAVNVLVKEANGVSRELAELYG